MDLSLTDEQRMLADSVRGVFAGADGDPTTGAEAPEGALEFRRDLWNRAAELGVTALVVDEEYGGAGAGVGEAYAAAGALGELAAPEQLTDLAYVPAWLLQDLATGDQKAAWLPPLAAGEKLITLAHAEPGTGWTDPRTTGVTDGRISGEKRAVAAPGDMDAFLVTAVEDGTPGVYLVHAGDGVDVTVHRDAEWAHTGRVTFRDAPAERLGAGTGDADRALRRAVALARVVQGGRAVGLMGTAMDQTAEYLKVRKQFGVTLNSFQVLKHRAAQLYADVELARSTALWAAAMAQTEGLSLEELETAALDSFVFLARQARVVAEESVQLHGGIGVTYETAVSHYAAALTGFRQLYGGELEARGAGVASGALTETPSALLDNALHTYS
ncbi:acyl-CoA dehydrogenase family protein [Corynebacterium kalidii]|uniref:Acyl-CoA dehydrogenase family protein n=1 Tax=Corynebacterium kalidii TaxID=2931982 RepID=A0A9X1WH53_9CORY|nr:acyl-CoA dehydrogenase family protein [Corynebacterium kalidii]MCJ7858560.1 acyl-CoA dehydrogenase family protein [Corynebacterium kalidii]